MTFVRRLFTIGALLGAILALPVAGHAQEATLTGTVSDATGGVLPGVTVTAVHDASTRFRIHGFPHLPETFVERALGGLVVVLTEREFRLSASARAALSNVEGHVGGEKGPRKDRQRTQGCSDEGTARKWRSHALLWAFLE